MKKERVGEEEREKKRQGKEKALEKAFQMQGSERNEPGLVVHACNPSSCETNVGGSLRVWGQAWAI